MKQLFTLISLAIVSTASAQESGSIGAPKRRAEGACNYAFDDGAPSMLAHGKPGHFDYCPLRQQAYATVMPQQQVAERHKPKTIDLTPKTPVLFEDFEKAARYLRDNPRPSIFVVCTENCVPCDTLKAEVATTLTNRYRDYVVCVTKDFKRFDRAFGDRNRDGVPDYAFPTTFAYRSDRKLQGAIRGYPNRAEYLDAISRVMEGVQ